VSPEGGRVRRGSGHAFFGALFLCVSLAVLVFSMREIPFLQKLADRAHLSPFFSPGRPGPSLRFSAPVVSYLSFESREAVAREAFALMETKKKELLEVERAREELEKERNTFAGHMERQKGLIEKYSSILEVARPDERASFFEATLRKRVALFHALYERKKSLLQGEGERLKGEIEDIAAYATGVGNAESVPVPPGIDRFFSRRAEQALLNRFFFLLDRGGYREAAGVLRTLVSLDRKGENRAQAELLRRLLVQLEVYRERTDALRKGGGFDELKMTYVSEDFGKAKLRAAALSGRLGGDLYMLPVLAEFQSALERNERLARDAEGDLATKDALRSLGRKAAALEKSGDLEKSLKIYKELLLFDLPAEDRERIVGKIGALLLASAGQEAKRRENTRASAYLEEAKNADREGREKEAEELYRKIILECPSSDYGGEALARLSALLKSGGG
jgi:tetratricopeptide (TPR) repeat protein